jgi:hypothetical protein
MYGPETTVAVEGPRKRWECAKNAIALPRFVSVSDHDLVLRFVASTNRCILSRRLPILR